MREAGISGISRRRAQGCTRRNPKDPLAPDLVQRQFTADAPDRLWVADITQHPTAEGWLYTAAVLDVFSRKAIGWAMSEHLHMQIVLDALNMAVRSRRPVPGSTIHHSDHGAQYTAMAYGQRLKATGLVGSMGSVGDAYDNALMESFWATLQTDCSIASPGPTGAPCARRSSSTSRPSTTAVASTPPSATSPQTRSNGGGSKPLRETNPTLRSHYVQLSTKPAKLQVAATHLRWTSSRCREENSSNKRRSRTAEGSKVETCAASFWRRHMRLAI